MFWDVQNRSMLPWYRFILNFNFFIVVIPFHINTGTKQEFPMCYGKILPQQERVVQEQTPIFPCWTKRICIFFTKFMVSQYYPPLQRTLYKSWNHLLITRANLPRCWSTDPPQNHTGIFSVASLYFHIIIVLVYSINSRIKI